MPLGERLDAAAQQLKGEAVGDPLVVARLQATLGTSLAGLGYPDKARDLFREARQTFTAVLGRTARENLSVTTTSGATPRPSSSSRRRWRSRRPG
jgi:hypothetical protein